MILKSDTPTVDEETVREYMEKVFAIVKRRNPHETEFHQTVKMLFDSLVPVLVKHPTYLKQNILERISEPERMISFKVPWIDDQGNVQVNRGYRVQFNGALGPYKGGIRFHPSVNPSI